MTLDDLRFTSVLPSPRWQREAALRLLKLLGFYSLLSLGGALLLLLARGAIAWATGATGTTFVFGLIGGGTGAFLLHRWLIWARTPAPSPGGRHLAPPGKFERERGMSLKARIEESPWMYFLGAILGSFIAGISAYDFILRVAKLDVVRQGTYILQEDVRQKYVPLETFTKVDQELREIRKANGPAHSVREEAVESVPAKQESHGSTSPNIFQGGSGSIDVRINEGSSVKPPHYDEPSEKEMKEALLGQIKRRGGVVKDSNTVTTENMLAGIAIEIVEFEKLGCNVASYGAGYFCTYQIVSKPTFYSTEGTEAGDAHAEGVSMLMKFFMGGDTSTETATRRFTKAGGGWVASAE